MDNRQKFSARFTFANPNASIKLVRSKFADGTDKTTLTGYPIVWGATSSDRGGYKVRLAKDSANFTDTALALWHHDFSKPLAGTANDSLRIGQADAIGIPVEIDLDLNTTAGKDAYAYVSSQLVGGMSFSMANGFEEYSESKEGDDRIINVSKYTVDEVTVTPIPAFSATTVDVKDNTPVPIEMDTDKGSLTIVPPAGGMSAQDTPDRIAASMRLASMRLEILSIK